MSSRGALLLVSCGLVATALGCKKAPSAGECADMLDRYVDMAAAQDPAFAGLTGDRAAALHDAKRAQKRLEPSYARARDQCEKDVSRAEYECAMAAPTPNDWEACIE